MAINSTALAPAARGYLSLAGDTLLCLTSAASTALQQYLPSLGSTLYSLPAAAYLTATVARQVLVSRTPEVQGNRFLKYLVSPWTLLAAYAIRGWNGWDLPEKIITGISALAVLHHAGQGLQARGFAAARGNPMAIAACAAHVANAIFGISLASASWNSHNFINFWPEAQPHYVQEGAMALLGRLELKKQNDWKWSDQCFNFLGRLQYLNKVEDEWIVDGPGISDIPVENPSYLNGIRVFKDPSTGRTQLRFNREAHQNLKGICEERRDNLNNWLKSPEYYFHYNTGVLWNEFARRIYGKNLPGTEASEVWRHMFYELQPRLQDFFSPQEMEYLEEIKIDSVVAGENFYPKWIQEKGFEKYVNKMVQWWEKEWYPAWSAMEARWQKADLPRKDEFDTFIHTVRKGDSQVYQPVRLYYRDVPLTKKEEIEKPLAMLADSSQKGAAYKQYLQKQGPITADALYQAKEADYRQWISFRHKIEKEFPADQILQFEGKAKSWESAPCKGKKIPNDYTNCRKWTYTNHAQKHYFHQEKNVHEQLEQLRFNYLAHPIEAESLYSAWNQSYQDWRTTDAALSRTSEEAAKINEDEKKRREGFRKESRQRVADQLNYWLTTPFKEIIKGESAERIVEIWKMIYPENDPKIWAKLTEEERAIIIDAENEVDRAERERRPGW